jgi:phosphoglycolate phosphatase-like HAD superfamily hydrolase
MQQTALVFDLDGTLVDSLPDLHAALNANVQVNRFGVPAREIATLGKCSPPNSGDKSVKQQTTKANGAPSAESQPELALDDLKQSAQRALAAGVLKQAAQDLRRFRGVTSRAGRAVYCDAYRWLTANEYSSPFAFLNVCRALGFSPETVRSALIENHSFSAFRNWRRRVASAVTL